MEVVSRSPRTWLHHPATCASRPYSYPGELRAAAWLAVPAQLCAESICKPRISPWLGLRVPSRTRWVGRMRNERARGILHPNSASTCPLPSALHRENTHTLRTYHHLLPMEPDNTPPSHHTLSSPFPHLPGASAVQSQKQRVRHPLGLGHVPVHTRSSASIERQD